MPRDDRGFAAAQVLHPAAEKEKDLAAMLPYVSLVDDVTVRTRGNELFQCIRLDGINSFTTDDALLDRTKELLASVVAQVGAEFSFYVHKVPVR